MPRGGEQRRYDRQMAVVLLQKRGLSRKEARAKVWGKDPHNHETRGQLIVRTRNERIAFKRREQYVRRTHEAAAASVLHTEVW